LCGARTYGSLQRRRQSEIGISMPTRACSPRIAHEGPVPQPLWPGPWPIPASPSSAMLPPAWLASTGSGWYHRAPPDEPKLIRGRTAMGSGGVKKRRAREHAR
jgi:hypothetical protein